MTLKTTKELIAIVFTLCFCMLYGAAIWSVFNLLTHFFGYPGYFWSVIFISVLCWFGWNIFIELAYKLVMYNEGKRGDV